MRKIDENFQLSKKQMERYLQRLKMDVPNVLDSDSLKRLQCRHREVIPYENLDIVAGFPISLNGQDLFEKIIEHKRGGYCFEVNGLYFHLLKALGYQVSSLAARFVTKGEPPAPRRHRILKVDFDGTSYITDIALRRESPRYAIELVEGMIQTDGIGEYRFSRNEREEWVLFQKLEEEWEPYFSFDESPQYEIDYLLANHYCQTYPDSPFLKEPSLSIYPENEHITITGKILKKSVGKVLTETKEIGSQQEFVEICREMFQIEPPNVQFI